MFFEKSRAQEGSIVAIGADPEALMGRAHDAASAFEEAYWTVLAGRLGREEGEAEVPHEMLPLFAALTKVVVEGVREEIQEAFTLRRETSEDTTEREIQVETEDELSEDETSREVTVEEVKPPSPRILGSEDLKSVIRETASESVGRKIAHALGRVS
jgi:hypothetical protein